MGLLNVFTTRTAGPRFRFKGTEFNSFIAGNKGRYFNRYLENDVHLNGNCTIDISRVLEFKQHRFETF